MDSFLRKFQWFIHQHKLQQGNEKVLVAISGGLDSVVMAMLFYKAEIPFALAHCNFSLREEESDADAVFVKALATSLNVPLFITTFNTKSFAKKEGISIQMAARNLRYEWFEKIRQEKGFASIATAHHQDDVTETILLNLLSGAVLTGIQGIRPKNKKLIRPLLWSSRMDIYKYAMTQHYTWREDSSNASDKYKRNYLRQHIIPLLEKLNPSIQETMGNAALQRQQIILWHQIQLEKTKRELFEEVGNTIEIQVEKLQSAQMNPAILFELIEPFGFSYTQCSDLFSHLEDSESKYFYSNTHRILKEKTKIVILPLSEKTLSKIMEIYPETTTLVYNEVELQFHVEEAHNTIIENNKDVAKLDFDLLRFPLQIRHWQSGDKFTPLGMKGSKSVSDFLIDVHTGMLDKENQLVILSENKIVWLVGMRIDERFKITEKTQNVIVIRVK